MSLTSARKQRTGAADVDQPRHDLAGIDALRAVGMLLVVLTHVGFNSAAGLRGPWAGWLARGDAGVAVFFVLSAFLLTRAFLRPQPVRVRVFLWHRLLRLAPAYLLAVLGVWILIPTSRDASVEVWLAAWTLTTTLVNLPFLPGLGQTWSLGTEVAFSLALPMLAVLTVGRPGRWVTARRTGATLVALAVGALLWRAVVLSRDDVPPSLAYWLPGFLDWFCAGMALAWLRERPAGPPAWLRESVQAPGAWWAIAAACYWVSTTPLCGPYDLSLSTLPQLLTKHLIQMCFAVALVTPVALAPPNSPFTRALSWKPLVWTGTVSYGVFLWHVILLTALGERARIQPFTGHFWPLLAFTLSSGLLMGAASWYGVERPIQRRWRARIR